MLQLDSDVCWLCQVDTSLIIKPMVKLSFLHKDYPGSIPGWSQPFHWRNPAFLLPLRDTPSIFYPKSFKSYRLWICNYFAHCKTKASNMDRHPERHFYYNFKPMLCYVLAIIHAIILYWVHIAHNLISIWTDYVLNIHNTIIIVVSR